MGSSDQSIDVGRKTLGIRLRWTAIATATGTLLSAAVAWAAHERSTMLDRLNSNENEIRGTKLEVGNLRSEVDWMHQDLRDLMRWQGVSPRAPSATQVH